MSYNKFSSDYPPPPNCYECDDTGLDPNAPDAETDGPGICLCPTGRALAAELDGHEDDGRLQNRESCERGRAEGRL